MISVNDEDDLWVGEPRDIAAGLWWVWCDGFSVEVDLLYLTEVNNSRCGADSMLITYRPRIY